MIAAQKQLIENADGVQERIDQVQREGKGLDEMLETDDKSEMTTVCIYKVKWKNVDLLRWSCLEFW